MEFDAGIQLSGSRHHSRRQIHPTHLNSAIVEIACNLSRTAAEVAGNARVAYALGEAIKQSTIQQLVLQLVVDTPGILVRNQVVAGLNVADFLADHLVMY